VTTTAPRATTPSARRRRRRRVLVPVLVLLFVGVLALGGWAWWRGALAALPAREHCTATALGNSTELDPEQAGNAAIIAAVAVRRGLPGRAATIGIATAMQESKLVNLPGGDRDSIGLFQQRPSQGWGTPAQIRDPVYASNAFYDVLVKVEGYEDLPITRAAQTVQRSAFPSAYADHEPEARILASALTGYSPAAVTCVLSGLPSLPAQAADNGGLTPRARAVARAAANEAGRTGAAVPGESTAVRFALPGKGGTTAGWALAQWAVARAAGLQIVSVETDGRRWERSRADEGWTVTAGSAPAGTVVVRVG
jgi:hypothetical protein